ncbi:MAG: SpaA isopeptide-forming pilin-related protein, partial [Oscillospiraceae bacterium]|nr:SpaA isopeptide-forming pilin-related protein [Oscillospiraceae bacterium]
MSNLLKNINKHKIISFIIAIFMILPILPAVKVFATVSGMTYYEHNFELPLYGATGCLVKDVGSISAGTAFTILEEQSTSLKVKLSNGTETTVSETFCMINLPDVVPSIKYDITNSYSSIFKIRGASIAGITGQSLYQYGTSKKSNPRLGKNEFLVPVLFDTAIKIAAAQKAALLNDYTLVVYEAYRPTYAQNKIYAAYSPLVTADIRGDYPTSWFIAPGKSNHQEGYAVDLTLAKVNSVSFATLSNPAYKIANLTVTNCSMITPIHDLTVDSAIYNYQSGMVIYDKTAWQSYTKTDAFAGNADCQRLQKYMTDAGLTPFAAEWWHYNDVDARNALGDLSSITSEWELTTNASTIEAAAINISPTSESLNTTGTITILSHDQAGNHIPIAHNGSPIPTTDAYYVGDDGNEYPAYCVDPDLPGVAEEGGTYDVTLSNSEIDSKILGMVLAGYPYKSLSELGLSNDWEGNLATKIAIKAYLKGWSMSDLTSTDDSGARALAAAKLIYAAGIAYTGSQAPAPTVTATATGGNQMTKESVGGVACLVKEYTVTSNVDIKSYTVTLPANAPAGTKITASDEMTEKTTFNAGEKFKLIIPESSVTSSGSITLDVKGEVANDVIMYGASTVPGTQNYVLTASPVVSKDASVSATYDIETTTTEPTTTEPTTAPPDTQPPTTTTTPPPSPGEFEIIKLEAGTNIPLPGAVFELKNTAGSVIYVGSTDDSGEISLSFDPGYYSVTEITPPKGYTLDPNPHRDNILIESGKTTTVTFTNKSQPELVIKKYDGTTGLPLPGAEFSVRKMGGSIVYEGVVDDTGVIHLDNLDEGWYEVSEIAAPEHYIKSTDNKQVYLEAGKVTEIKFDNIRKPSLKITKLDSQTNAPLAGAKFHVQKADSETISDYVTDETGEILIDDLDAAVYSVWEFEAPDGYVCDPTPKNITLEGGDTKSLVFTDKSKPSLTIKKYDGITGEPLPGAEFSLATMAGRIVYEGITDSLGVINIANLDEGWYKATEIAAPEHYIISTDSKDVYLEAGKTVEIKFDNIKRPSLKIVKYDSDTNAPLPGAKFKVQKTESSTVSDYVTDENGAIEIFDLDAAIYSVWESEAPAGYLCDSEHKDIQLEAGTEKTLVFTNKARPKLEIKKIDSVTGLPLAGAKFKVTKTDDNTVSEYVTDEKGTILLENLDESIYTVDEIASPAGYILASEHKDIQLEAGKTKTLIFDNIKKPTLIITKLNGLTYLPVPDTTYRIEYEDGNGGVVNLGTFRTNRDGQIILPQVNPGWYRITETIPAQGFSLPSNPVTRKYLAPGENAYTNFDVQSSVMSVQSESISGDNIQALSGSDFSALAGEEIINYPLNSIVIRKVNAITGEFLAGAAFEVRKVSEDISGNSGTVIGRYTTDNSGVIVVTGLTAGAYIVEEVQAPANFLLSENSQQQAWLKADGTSIVEVTFANFPYGNLLVTKIDAQTGKPLASARFKVTDGAGAVAGNSNGEFVTDANGQFLASNLKPGSYVVTEIEAPQDYAIDTTPQTIHIGTDGKTYTLNFKNQPLGGLIITKRDSVTKESLAGAQFQITDSHGAFVGDSTNGLYTTDATGIIKLDHINTGAYVVKELKAPTGYLTDNTSQTVQVEYGMIKSVDFYNQPLGGLLIKKYNSVTKEPLANAVFKVTDIQGAVVGTSDGLYRTDETGTIYIYGLKPGGYRVEEVQAPNGFLLDNTAQTIQIIDEKMYSLEFFDQPVGSLQIRKFDSQSRQPLANARFKVTTQDGRFIGDYTTDVTGYIQIPNLLPNFYVVEEVSAPSGYLVDSTPKTIEVKVYDVAVVDFYNSPMSSVIIKKFDSVTKDPLLGAKFKITNKSGEIVGEYNTDSNGLIQVDNLEPGWYSATEISAPMGYKLYDAAQDFEITNTKTVTLEFPNEKLTSLIIKKVDEFTGAPLIGAQFSVEKQNGERVGDYTTDNTGLINIPTLDPDWYVVRETKAPVGYQLDETPQTVEVKTAVPTVVTFTDRPLSGIEIIKVDAVTHTPLTGATFTIERDNGERIGTYKTDISGKIIVPDLLEGTYIVSETVAPINYILDETPKMIIVKSNKLTTVEFQNNPKSGLQIVKIDANTKNPLKGAKFTIYRMDGGIVGTYETNGDGVIIIGQLESGWYKASESKAPDGYQTDDTPQDFQVTSGQFIKLTFEDKPLASLQIKKINEVTGAPLAGAQFNVTKQNGEYVGEYTTDNDGFINIPTLEPGWYVVKETRQPAGYIIDETPKTVEVKTSVPTVVTFSNKPMSGLHILKLDSVTRAPLEGVEFLVSKMNGERIGTFKTDKSGSIYISDLDSGWYTVSEIKGLEKYHIDPTPRNIEIKWGEPVVMEWTNAPYSELLIKKTAKGTDAPLANVEFMVTKFNGEQIGTFTTDSSGQ